MLLKDYQVKRPSSTKIQRGYVYQVIESNYDPVRKFNTEKRKLIGKMIDDENMIPNENFEYYYPDLILKSRAPAVFSDLIHVGNYTLIAHLLDKLKLSDLLEPLFLDHHQLICDLLAYMIIEESCEYEYFEYFERQVPTFSRKVYSDSSVSRLLSEYISVKDINTFLEAWNKINSKISNDVYVNYDSTNFPSRSSYGGLSEYGYAKDDDELEQVNLSYVSSKESGTPLSYCLYPGSIHDTSEVAASLKNFERYGYRNIGFIFDRAYYSLKLIRYLKKNSCFFIMMLKDSYDYVKKIIKEERIALSKQVSCYIEEYGVSGISKRVNLSDDEKKPLYCYVHVYYNRQRATQSAELILNNVALLDNQLADLFENDKTITKDRLTRYEKYFRLKYDASGHLMSYSKNEKVIEKAIDEAGYFALLSEKKLNAKEVLDIYHQRDAIEKLFRALKSSLDFSHAGVHSKKSLEAKVFLTFLASIIRNEILIKRNAMPLNDKKYYTVPTIIKQLFMIEAAVNSDGRYSRRYALTKKQKKILSLFGLNEKDIDKTILDFNKDIS